MNPRPLIALGCISAATSGAARAIAQAPQPVAAGPRVEITVAKSARAEPTTGMVYLALSRDSGRTPIAQTGPTGAPLFSVFVAAQAPGAPVTITRKAAGHPVASLADIPAGEYWMQPFVNVYTRFPRADGKTLWLHMDQWEGQRWKISPGNVYGDPVRVRFDPRSATPIRLVADKVIPPIEPPPDTKLVKRIKFESRILTKWWGHPIYLGATVLLPKDYDQHPDVHYPVIYEQGHFSLRAPENFGAGTPFDTVWQAADTPRLIYVTLQHPSPYYDDSYGVNSENNGPYGDAIMQELVPAVEEKFRVIREPWARTLAGGSTGGWIAAALQIFYPDFYGGSFASCPDAVDFRYHQIVDIYQDANAYFVDRGWTKVERPNRRLPDGRIEEMMKDENRYELVVGDHSRSGGQWDIWEATFSPRGEDGYPKRLWNKMTGEIDKSVAVQWRRYDLRHLLESNWSTLGPKVGSRLNVYVGDMDSFYLNDGVEKLNEFLVKAEHPKYTGEVVFQRRAPHCWGPRGAELIAKVVHHIERTAPASADLARWRY